MTDGTGFPVADGFGGSRQTTVWTDVLVAFDASVHGSTLQRPMPPDKLLRIVDIPLGTERGERVPSPC